MKYLIILFLVFGMSSSVIAQTVNQDSEGNSSIVWPGGNFSFDVSEELIKFNYYSPFNNAKGTLYGIDIQGKNNSGIANLFEENEFAPEAKISFLIGTHNSESRMGKQGNLLAIYNYEKSKYEILTDRSLEKFKITFNNKAGILKGSFNASPSAKEELVESLIKKLKNTLSQRSVEEIKAFLEAILQKNDLSGALKTNVENFVNALSADTELNNYGRYKKELEKIVAKKTALSLKQGVYSIKRVRYVRGGIHVQEFKHDRGTEFTTFDTRFTDEKYAAPFIETGYSRRKGDQFWGINIGIDGLNNFSELNKTAYTITSDTSLVEGSLESENSFEAYSGDYKTFFRVRVNTDYMFTSFLQGNKYLYLGPYARFNYSSNTSALDHNVVLGAGAFLVNGKDGAVLGGVYLQSNRVLGNENIDFSKTISFGLVAKFAFTSAKPTN